MNWIIYTLLLIMAIVIWACGDSKVQQSPEIQTDERDSLPGRAAPEMETIYLEPTEHIEFDFTLRKQNPYKEMYEVEAVLINHNDFPIYYKTRTCYELQGDLVFDKSKFSLGYVSNCRTSFSVITELAAKAKFVYTTKINNFSHAKTILLGLNFCPVSKPNKMIGDRHEAINYDLVTREKIRAQQFIDYEQKWAFKNRSDRQVNAVIWAKEKSIPLS